MVDRGRRRLAGLGTALLLVAGPGCGKDGVGDQAMDRSFQGGKAYPVHPPRGERKEVRRKGAMMMQSDPLDCIGNGEQTLANTSLQVTGPTAVLVKGGCRLRLVNVDVIGNDGAVVEDGSSFVMVGGSITAKGVAVRADGEASVELSGVAISGATGVQAAGTAKVTTEGGSITGSGAALALRGTVSMVTQGTALDGPVAKDETVTLTMVDGSNETPEAER